MSIELKTEERAVSAAWSVPSINDGNFIIRRCHIGDEASLSLVGKATFLETYAENTDASDLMDFLEAEHTVERYRSWLKSDLVRIWVAQTTLGGSAIGYAVALSASKVGLDQQMEIKRLYLLHRFHRRGLGHLLLKEILTTARKVGTAGLFLKVQEANQSAVTFYRTHGFSVVGPEPFRVGATDYAALVMGLTLRRPVSKSFRATSDQAVADCADKPGTPTWCRLPAFRGPRQR
jgi:GNAT superfamily N-acetyltransferase